MMEPGDPASECTGAGRPTSPCDGLRPDDDGYWLEACAGRVGRLSECEPRSLEVSGNSWWSSRRICADEEVPHHGQSR